MQDVSSSNMRRVGPHLDEHGSVTMACLSLSTIHFSKIAGSPLKLYVVENLEILFAFMGSTLWSSFLESGIYVFCKTNQYQASLCRNLLVGFLSLGRVGGNFPLIALNAF